jgi:hypothetical protein
MRAGRLGCTRVGGKRTEKPPPIDLSTGALRLPRAKLKWTCRQHRRVGRRRGRLGLGQRALGK